MDFKDVWVEKYRPSSVDDIVLSDELYHLVDDINKTKTLPTNLLFVGHHGIGKTSLTKVICDTLLEDCQYLYLNTSNNSGIDMIREKVINFSQTKSMFDSIKVVVIDEADAISFAGQQALRNTMEEYLDITRFILTANYKHKIIEPIQSRCQSYSFRVTKNDYGKHLLKILKDEKLTINTNDIKQLVDRCYPDFRSGINALHKYKMCGELFLGTGVRDIIRVCFSKIRGQKYTEMRKHIIKNEQIFNGDYNILFKELFEYIYSDEYGLSAEKNRDCMLTASEYYYRNATVLDKEINFFSCLLAISKNIIG